MKIKIEFKLPINSNDFAVPRGLLSRTYDSVHKSPFGNMPIPHTKDTVEDLNLKILSMSLTEDRGKSRFQSWSISGKVKTIINYKECLTTIHFFFDCLKISNPNAKDHDIEVFHSENYKYLQIFIHDLLAAKWVDESNHFSHLKLKMVQDTVSIRPSS